MPSTITHQGGQWVTHHRRPHRLQTLHSYVAQNLHRLLLRQREAAHSSPLSQLLRTPERVAVGGAAVHDKPHAGSTHTHAVPPSLSPLSCALQNASRSEAQLSMTGSVQGRPESREGAAPLPAPAAAGPVPAPPSTQRPESSSQGAWDPGAPPPPTTVVGAGLRLLHAVRLARAHAALGPFTFLPILL